jgi:hypothetical protein
MTAYLTHYLPTAELSKCPAVTLTSFSENLIVKMHPAITQALLKRAEYMGVTISELIEDAVERLLRET